MSVILKSAPARFRGRAIPTYNPGLECDGVDDRITYTPPGGLTDPRAGFAWSRMDSSATNQYLVSDFNATPTYSFLWWYFTGNELRVQWAGDSGNKTNRRGWATLGTSSDQNAVGFSWGGDFEGDSPDVYLNGALDNGTGVSGVGFTQDPIRDGWTIAGRPSDNNRNWNGNIAWLTLWSEELTAAEHAALAAGAHPLTIRPNAIIFHPDNARRVDVATQAVGVPEGGPTIAPFKYERKHPRVIDLITSSSAAPPVGSAPIYLFHNRHHNRSA